MWDIVVNSTILEMWGMDTFTVAGDEVMHLAPNGKEGCNYNAEEVYQMLLKTVKNNPPSPGSATGAAPGGGKILDRHDVWKGIQDRPRLRDGWDRRIQEAAGRGVGTEKMTQRMRKLVEQLQQRSKVNWRQLLHDFIQHTCYDYNFLPPDRRFSDGDFYLPAFNIDEDQGTVNDIWVCVDTSGSITDQELMKPCLRSGMPCVRPG